MEECLSKSKRLEQDLEDLILHGTYHIFDRFLSVAQLKKQYSASQATVVQALEHLEAKGLIFSRSRSGTYISPVSRTKQILIVSSGTRYSSSELNQFTYGLGEAPSASKGGWVTVNCTIEEFEENLPNLPIIYKKLFAVIFFRCPETLLKHHEALCDLNIFHMFYGSSAMAKGLKGCHRYCYNENDLVSRALDILYERGHRRIACFSCPGATFEERTRCYRNWHQAKGLPVDEELIFVLGQEDGYSYMLSRLKCRVPACTAFFCASNLNMGSGLHQALKDSGVSIPEDMAILGIGNVETARFLRPALSTLDIDYQGDTRALIELFSASGTDVIRTGKLMLGESAFIFIPGSTI